jgi:pimeloyl-ACP methyl ester carboxylesterase
MAATDMAQWRAAGRSYDHRGHPVFYREAGDADSDTALVLIHGFPTASWDWHRIWEPLATKFPRLVAPDMIGFGYSAKPRDYRYSIFDQADLHENLLRSLGVGRIHILAHDYGDTVAQELLARHEDRKAKDDDSLVIDSCVLLNGGLFPETHRARLVQKLLLTSLGPLLSRLMSRRSFGKSFAAIFGANTQPSAGELDEFWQLMAHNDGQLIAHKLITYIPERRANRERWVGTLQKTKVPLRVINGPDDPVSGAHMVARYRELIPSPDTVSLPGIGHYPQVEDAGGVLRAFLEFHDTKQVRG